MPDVSDAALTTEPIEQAVDADSVADARRVLAAAEKQQRDACAAEIADVLGRHGFDFQVTPAQITLVRRST